MTRKDNAVLFGAAYYLEYMPYDRLEKDLDMMQEAGMNTVRIAESTWSTLEPREGVFDFSYIDRVLSEVEKRGMCTIIGTPTYAIPSWLEKKCPEVMVYNKDGRAKYGHRQIMDIMHPVFREHAEIVIRKLIEHTASHPTVIGFQIDNETKHYGTASKEVQALFKQYLMEKYRTTERLNQVFHLSYWSNSIHDWDDLPDMLGCIHGGLASEFEKFQRSLAAQYLQWQADIVSEYKTAEQFITHNFDFEWKKFGADIAQDGYSYGVQPDINHYEASKAVTIAGTDIYHPTQDALTGAEIAFGGDSIRSLKNDNYFVLECQAQAFKYWTPYPGQLRLQGYSHLASGAQSILYWNWHSIHNGYETYWKGVLSHDLDTNPTYEEASIMGKEFAKFGKDKLCIHKENKVAVLVDSHSMTSFKWFPIDKDLSYNDVVRWMYDSLYEMNVECDIVDIHALDEQSIGRYEMLVTPVLYSVSEEKITLIRDFVKSGGTLVSSFKSFVANEELTVYHDVQPHGMTECFGMTYNQFTEPGKTRLFGEKLTYFAELLTVESAEVIAQYEHKYWGKYAGITHNVYGNGSAYYVGCFTSKDILKKVLQKALLDAGLESENNLIWPVTIRSGINALGEKLHYLCHYSEDEREITSPYEKVRDILTNHVYQKGDTIRLADWDVLVLQEL